MHSPPLTLCRGLHGFLAESPSCVHALGTSDTPPLWPRAPRAQLSRARSTLRRPYLISQVWSHSCIQLFTFFASKGTPRVLRHERARAEVARCHTQSAPRHKQDPVIA